MAKVINGKTAMLLAVIATLALVGACTSSNSSVQTNPNYNANLNSPTRTPEKYGNPSGQNESENKKPADQPVAIMQVSMEVPAVEVNLPYNLYALVSNPSAKDIQYKWSVTSGKLSTVTEEDKAVLNKTVEDALAKSGAAAGAASPATPTGETGDEAGGDKTVDGKLIPAEVNPNDALKNQGTPGSQEFKEGEPVAPPQITGQQNQPTRNTPGVAPTEKIPSGAKEVTVGEGGAATPPVEETATDSLVPKPKIVAGNFDGVQLASAWVNHAFNVRYAALSSEETQPESATTEAETGAEGDNSGTSETTGAESEPPAEGEDVAGTDATDESTPDEGSEVTDETADDAAGVEEVVETEVESPSDLPLDDPGYKELPPATDTPLGMESGEGSPGFGRHWPTPWGDKSNVVADKGNKLITDIQNQIETEIAKQQSDTEAIKSREPITLTTSDPFIRWIPDTAESVIISLTIVNLKGIEVTETTVLDVEVTTPQPKVELAYEMPEDGLEPGDTLDVALKVKNIPDYRRSLIGVNFDLNNFDISSVQLGDLFDKGENKASMYYAQPDKSSGLVTVAIALEDMIRSVRGSGEAFVIGFEAKAPIPADIADLGFTIAKEANYRYIQDTSGENQLPPVADGATVLQSAFVAPPQPAPEETPAAEGAVPGTTPGTEGAPGVVGPGGAGLATPGGVVPPEGASPGAARDGAGGPGGDGQLPAGIKVTPGGDVPPADQTTPPDQGTTPPPDQQGTTGDDTKKPPQDTGGLPVSAIG